MKKRITALCALSLITMLLLPACSTAIDDGLAKPETFIEEAIVKEPIADEIIQELELLDEPEPDDRPPVQLSVHTGPPKTFDEAKLYAAYYDILENMLSEYGLGGENEEHVFIAGATMGLYSVNLLDFDNDGIPELIITYMGDEAFLYCEIYGYYDDQVKLYFKGESYIFSTGPNLYGIIMGSNGIHYLFEQFIHNSGHYDIYYTMQNSEWVPIFEMRYENLDSYTDSDGNLKYERVYYVNDEPVNEDVYYESGMAGLLLLGLDDLIVMGDEYSYDRFCIAHDFTSDILGNFDSISDTLTFLKSKIAP